jgi:hypothetical protein
MTRARRLLFAFASLALAACGASSSGARAMTGAAGSTGAGGSTGAAGTGAPACQVNIVPISPASFDGLQAGPMSVMRVRGDVTGAVSPLSIDWSWTVSLADGTPVPVKRVEEASLVEFTMTSVGTYTIAVELTGTTCAGAKTITTALPGGKIASFRLRVTPPSTALVPAQDLVRQVVGGTPSGGNVLALSPGIIVGIDVVKLTGGDALPSYVRLTDAATGAVIETRTQAGPTTLRVADGMYSMLVVPDGDVAPVAFPPRAAAEIGSANLALDDGTMISGSISAAGNLGVIGTSIVLRAGDLVSTTGTTDATGAFHVRVRAGTFGLTVVSPLAQGGLEAKLAATGGLVVDPAKPSGALAIRIDPGPLATGTVALSATDPTSLSPAPRISLATTTPLANVATLTVGTAAPQTLAGDVRFSLQAASDGTLSTGGVPRGRYQLTVFPGTSTSSEGVTTTTLDLTAGSAGPLAVSLAKKVMLTGKLLPTAAASGVRLFALDDAGLPVIAEADAGPGGVFQMLVSPGRTYALRALPRPDQALARATFPMVTVTNIPYVLQDQSLPAGLLYGGRVVDPSLQGVGTALVQAFCVAAAPGCADPAVPVAETVTRSDGTFQLMLPDPGGSP